MRKSAINTLTMLTAGTLKNAVEAYRKGVALFQGGKFEEAIPFFSRAADGFRNHSAAGHPAEYVLENGVSALANSLCYLGVCSERTGDVSRAITCFETAYINDRFEKPAAFRMFARDLDSRLVACYERQLEASATNGIASLPKGDPAIDNAYRFPFSLDPKFIPFARLYELSPQRYGHLRTFYETAKRQDAVQRQTGSRTDDQSMRKISLGVWSVIAVIWAIYGIVVVRALMHSF